MESALKNPISHRQPFFESHVKTLQSGGISSSHVKALGGSGEDLSSQQAAWYSDAYAYYKAVMNGEVARPSDTEWNEFVNQMNWVYEQLRGSPTGGAGGDPGLDGFPTEGGVDQGPSVNEFGGVMGPDGNWIYDAMDSRIGFVADPTPNHSWSFDNNLDVASTSAKVTAEITNDGVNPPSSVLKVIVKGPMGESVYYYHNYTDPDFKLNINVPKETQVSGVDTLPADITGKVKVGKYDPNKKPEEDVPQSSVTGQPVEGKENEWYYKAEDITQTIDFRPKAGENETHYVVGNSTISLELDASANVTKGPFNVNGSTYDYMIVVTNADKSTDTFYVKKPFNTHINAVEGSVSFNGIPAEGSTVPDDFSENIALYVGDGSPISGGADSVDAQQIIDDFISTAGLDNEDQLIAAFQSAGYTDFKKIDDVKKAIEKGEFPPKEPDLKLITLLASLDPDLKGAIEDVTKTATDNAGKDDLDSKVQAKMQVALDRLQELLQKLYPKSIVEVSDVTGPTFGSVAVGTLTIKNADGTSNSHQVTLDPASGDLII